MAEKKHSKKEVQVAIEYAESKGSRIELSKGSSHAWGMMYCPYNSEDYRCGEYCISSIWSTPRSSGNHAKQIRKIVDRCTGMQDKREG